MNATPYITKPGADGTLYSFEVEVTPCDPGQAPYKVRRWAYDANHAAERVADDPMIDGDDFRIIGKVRA